MGLKRRILVQLYYQSGLRKREVGTREYGLEGRLGSLSWGNKRRVFTARWEGMWATDRRSTPAEGKLR